MSSRLTTVAVLTIFAAFAAVAATYLYAQDDDRTLLALNASEQKAVRSEMRKLLVSVSDILTALNEKDMTAVAAAARPSGMAMAKQVEVSLKKKLPPGFMKLGKSVHVGFDDIADAANNGADQAKIIALLAQQTHRCTACHAVYGLR